MAVKKLLLKSSFHCSLVVKPFPVGAMSVKIFVTRRVVGLVQDLGSGIVPVGNQVLQELFIAFRKLVWICFTMGNVFL